MRTVHRLENIETGDMPARYLSSCRNPTEGRAQPREFAVGDVEVKVWKRGVAFRKTAVVKAAYLDALTSFFFCSREISATLRDSKGSPRTEALRREDEDRSRVET